MEIDTILWRKLDTPGHDACHLIMRDNGWELNGTAVFLHKHNPVCLTYEVECDGEWRTRNGQVNGWIGDRLLDFQVERTSDDAWILNGKIQTHLAGCIDLDLGFTPATNLFQLRRIALRVGQKAFVPVAWLDALTGAFIRLKQSYERRSAEAYWYESPRFEYSGLLLVNTAGFVEKYPGLWEIEKM